MWTTDRLGLASWSGGGSKWYFDARGGDGGIGIVAVDDRSPNPYDATGRFVSLEAVEQDLLPTVGEQYVRGDRWHVNYPQGDGAYALRLAFQPIQSGKDLMVLELTISIQTDFLDTHPKIDINAPGQPMGAIFPTGAAQVEASNVAGAAPISIARCDDHSICVLLGPHDSPFTADLSTASQLRLRMFGQFLEKGVIRKARPWIVIDRSGSRPSDSRLETWWKQLCDSPLPLTP